MSISPGTRLGPYEIQSAIGQGGMGEVYSATDTRLDRTVAIKVLPADLAADPDRRERFEREAKAIAALNHPHICTLHDVGHEDGTDFLVMERLEGESLQDRLTRGALPVDQALQIAIQIADALDRAHRQGITHRDLKPGNIFLVGKGAAGQGAPQAKLLDFGLAKLTDPVRSATASAERVTKLADSLTLQGMILGTFQYMAPEQLDGGEADHRADIWAFGCVVYEMVTGRKPFEEQSQASLIHAIIGVEPRPVSDTQPVASRSLDHVLRRCLAKDPADRWQTVRDVHQELRWVVEQSSLEPETVSPAVPARAGWRRAVTVAASLVVGAALSGVVLLQRTEMLAPALVTRVQVPFTPATAFGSTTRPLVDLSPDGRTVAFAGRGPDEADSSIFVRPLDAREATLLSGTERGFAPEFSPDGTWIAYRTLNELFKVPVGGGRPISLVRLENVFRTQGLAWGENDWIYYAENINQTAGGGLLRVQASGGQPERVARDEGATIGWPELVGGGRFVLFSRFPAGAVGWDAAQIMLLDTQTGETRVLVEAGGSSPKVTPSGHLMFVRDGRAMAAPFDLDRLVVTGPPVGVLDDVQYENSTGTAQWAIADNGTLVYQSGVTAGNALMWIDARGELRAFPGDQTYYDPRLSPDGRAVAVEVLGAGDDIWVLDLMRGAQTKLSQGPVEDETPAWSPDGMWVAWSTTRDEQRAILRKRADGSGPEETLWSGPEHTHVSMYGLTDGPC